MTQEQSPTTLRRPSTAVVALLALLVSFGLGAGLSAALGPAVGEKLALVVFAAGAIPLAVIDARTYRLPNIGTLPLAAAMLGYLSGVTLLTQQWPQLVQAVLCSLVITAITLLIGMLGTLAYGDIKLMLAIGLLTGWATWWLPLYALTAGYLLALPHAIYLTVRHRRHPAASTHLAFGPYLIAGALLTATVTLLTT